MRLEYDLQVNHMIYRSVILSKGDVLRELVAATKAKIQEYESYLDFLTSYRSQWIVFCDFIVSHL